MVAVVGVVRVDWVVQVIVIVRVVGWSGEVDVVVGTRGGLGGLGGRGSWCGQGGRGSRCGRDGQFHQNF